MDWFSRIDDNDVCYPAFDGIFTSTDGGKSYTGMLWFDNAKQRIITYYRNLSEYYPHPYPPASQMD